MKSYFSMILLSLVTFTATSVGAAPPVMKMLFQLSPAGSFTATSLSVTGQPAFRAGKWVLPPSVTVDMNSFKTGIELRDTHLKRHLGSDKFPRATLTEIKVVSADKGSGKLNFHGVTKAIEFTYALNSAKDRVTAKFNLTISDFGIKDGLSYMGVGVENETAIEVELPVGK